MSLAPGIAYQHWDAWEERLLTRIDELLKQSFAQQSTELVAILTAGGLQGWEHEEDLSKKHASSIFRHSTQLEIDLDEEESGEWYKRDSVKTDSSGNSSLSSGTASKRRRSSRASISSAIEKMKDLAKRPSMDSTEARLVKVMKHSRDNCAQRMVQSVQFRLVVSLMIFAQSAVLGWEASTRSSLEFERLNAMRSTAELPQYFVTLEHVFSFFFLIELLMRIFAWRGKFFSNSIDNEFLALNIFDTLLVLAWLLIFVDIKVSWLRAIRLVRIARVLRLVRMLRVGRKLRHMLIAFYSSFDSMFWLLLLLGSCIYVFSLAFMHGAFLILADIDAAQYQELKATGFETHPGLMTIQSSFRSLRSTMLSLFASFTGGSEWDTLFAPFMEYSPLFTLIVIAYVGTFTFCVMNVVTGIFVQDCERIASQDQGLSIDQFLQAKMDSRDDIEYFVSVIDTNNDGFLSHDELREALEHPTAQSWLGTRGMDLNVHNLDVYLQFFGKVPRQKISTCQISTDKFVNMLLSSQGEARHAELVLLSHRTEKILHRIKKLEENLFKFSKLSSRSAIASEHQLGLSTSLSVHAEIARADGEQSAAISEHVKLPEQGFPPAVDGNDAHGAHSSGGEREASSAVQPNLSRTSPRDLIEAL